MSRLVAIAVVALTLAGCSGKQEPRPIQFGQPVALTGTEQARGLQERHAVALAVEDVNGADGQLLNRPLEVIHANSGSTPRGSAAVVVRLIQVNKVSAILGDAEVADLDNLGSLSQSSTVPFVIASGSAGRPTGKRVLFTGIPDVRHGQILGRFALKTLKPKSVAILSDGQAGRFELIEAFARALPGEQLVGRWSYSANGASPRFGARERLAALVKEIVERQPEAVLFAGPPEDCLEACRALGSIPVLFAGSEGSLAALRAARVDTPLFLVTAFAAEIEEKPVQEFVARYQKKYGLPPDVHAALAFDNTRLLAAGIKQADSLDADKIIPALHELTFTGLTGECKFDKQQVLARPAYVLKLTKGKVAVAEKVEAGSP